MGSTEGLSVSASPKSKPVSSPGTRLANWTFFVECIDTMGTFWLWEEFHFLNNHELSLWALAWLLHKCCIKDARLEMCKLLK